MDGGAWGAGGLAAGALGGFFTAWFRYRTAKAETVIHHDTAAFEGYDELVTHYRQELERLEVGMTSLRKDHSECQSRLSAAERDLDDLRGDLNVLKGLVVTQIQAEADRDKED